MNSALYFSAMEEDGGLKKYPTNKSGAKYGTGTVVYPACLSDGSDVHWTPITFHYIPPFLPLLTTIPNDDADLMYISN